MSPSLTIDGKTIREHRERLYPPTEAAAYLGLGKSTLAKMRLAGNGPSYRKFGRSVRYAMPDLQAWADAHKRRSTSDAGQAVQGGDA